MTLSLQVEPLLLRVTNKPHVNKEKVVFFAVKIDPTTWKNLESKTHYVIEVEDSNVSNYFEKLAKGVVCLVTPKTILQKEVYYNGVIFSRKIISTDFFEVVRSEGNLIINLLSSGKFKGIGELKAKKLWDRFGEELYDILDNKRIERLTNNLEGGLTFHTATKLIASWEVYLNSEAIKFCSQIKLSISQATNVIDFYQDDTEEKLKEDPYRLLAFKVPFKFVDNIAMNQLGLDVKAPKRIAAAMEEALYRVLDAGSVVAHRDQLYPHLKKLLLDESLANIPFKEKFECNNCYVSLNQNTFQTNGSYIMESLITEKVISLIGNLPTISLSNLTINKLITQYQLKNDITLTDKQKLAVYGAINNNICLINGGAGVGKTTVLDCIYYVFDEFGIMPAQVALAAKAAKRMTEVTGKPASTIARFVWHNNKFDTKPEKLALIIDESSMVDLFSMYQLIKWLPENSRLIMLGDVGQLPPVGYGLVFHELLKVKQIPHVTLKEVKRQSSTSSIPSISNIIAAGEMPDFNTGDVKFIKSLGRKSVLNSILAEYEKDTGNTQIICATNSLVDEVNIRCSNLNPGKKLLVYNDFFGSFEITGFKLYDKVICTKNLYNIDVMNGSLGKIVACYNSITPREVVIDSTNKTKAFSLGVIEWDDGQQTEISEELYSNLSLSYAITVHKSQGSQYPKVIIPAFQASNMDRSMLYTAITRAEKSVVIIGSDKIIAESLRSIHSEGRKSDLANKLTDQLNKTS
tara:strand:+ start:12156 stop:14393 length:2238 start_codon:yes stop_codon:yes gene_type:complete